MASGDLRRLIYISRETHTCSEVELIALLNQSRHHNHSKNLHGFLVYADGVFIQVLEGSPDVVAARYAVIAEDPRHTALTVLYDRCVAERHYADWHMGFKRMAHVDLQQQFPLHTPELADSADDATRDAVDQALLQLIQGPLPSMASGTAEATTADQLQLLVVDDHAAYCELITDLLEVSLEVVSVHSGEEAVQYAQQYAGRLGMILLDVMMPRLDGYQVCQQLKQHPDLSDIPIIMMTGRLDRAGEARCFQVGAADFIPKPLSREVLNARVRQHYELFMARRTLQRQTDQLRMERAAIVASIGKVRSCFAPEQSAHFRYGLSSVEQTSGDLVLRAQTVHGREWILLGDFTGHGLVSAIASPVVANCFAWHSQHTQTAAEFLQALNQILTEQLPVDMFMACVVLERLANPDRVLVFNAGMPSVVVQDGTQRRDIAASFLPLGISSDLQLTEPSGDVLMAAQTQILAFSDGLSECAPPDGQTVSVVDQLCLDVQAQPNLAIDSWLAALQPGGANRRQDDRTLVVLYGDPSTANQTQRTAAGGR